MEYVGVDSDEAALTKARQFSKSLKLKKIRFLNMEAESLTDLEDQFDFIILNRLYSWIDPSQRNALWEFCSTHLTENGMVYINFNALPGWAELLTLRKLVKYRLARVEDLDSAIFEIQKFLPAFFKLVTPPENVSKFSDFLKDEITQILSLLNSDRKQIFVEDFLGDENHPVYLTQLLNEAKKFDLKFLANCDLSNADRSDLSGDVVELLQKKSRDQNDFEQYIDFFALLVFKLWTLNHLRQCVSIRKLSAIPATALPLPTM
jgi:SAM-dependent methyltransferase